MVGKIISNSQMRLTKQGELYFSKLYPGSGLWDMRSQNITTAGASAKTIMMFGSQLWKICFVYLIKGMFWGAQENGHTWIF